MTDTIIKPKHKEGGSHYYTVDGLPRHDATLREARKENLLPSVTTVIKSWSNEMLTRYKINEAIKACILNPKLEDETPEDYAQRCLELSWKHSEAAAGDGVAVHDQLEGYNNAVLANTLDEHHFDPELEQFCLPFVDYSHTNLSKVLSAEITLANQNLGIAGRTDLVALHKGVGCAILDYKTTKVKTYKGKKDPGFWPSYCWQLSAYAKMYQIANQLPDCPRIISLVVDLDTPAIYEKIWDEDDQKRGWAFMEHLIAAWQIEKRYKPTKSYT